ncbi:MAG: hypothetical protein NT004_18425 [Bacteroidetes bacterium]|nr:hypothetical protein [Bacteroidota bacterium]
MTNREKIKKDIVVAFDFVDQLLANPEMLEKIPDGSTIRFLDSEKEIREKKNDKGKKQYVRVKKHFELL